MLSTPPSRREFEHRPRFNQSVASCSFHTPVIASTPRATEPSASLWNPVKGSRRSFTSTITGTFTACCLEIRRKQQKRSNIAKRTENSAGKDCVQNSRPCWRRIFPFLKTPGALFDSLNSLDVMTDLNSNKANAGEPSRRSFELARRELRVLVAKIEEGSLFNRSVKLFRARSLLRPAGSKLHRRHLWILLILAWILGQFLWNYSYSLRYDKCLAVVPSFTQKIFRPAEDCSICRDVQQVDRISNVDPAAFEERYAYSGTPVVVTDAMANWTAPEVFSFSFFKSLYDGREANCQFFPYKTEFKSLQDVFEMSTGRASLEKGTKPWYVGWSNCDEEIGNVLRQHYQRPYFLPDTAESEKTDWIFMGSHGYGAPMHVDDVEHPSWQAQIKGEKRWILEPPRECHYTCNRMQVTVHPGEIIVLDTNRWYHQTEIVSEEMSITIGAEYD